MTHAYSESYLDDAMQNLADMVDYAVHDCGYDPDSFFELFIASGIADKFEKGNPKYVVGMSGIELAREVLRTVNINMPFPEKTHTEGTSQEYWAGWIIAYYQWMRKKRFQDIVSDGLPLSRICDMYILHEADESKFVETADIIIERHRLQSPSKLQQIRKARGYTQKNLSDASGVTLRMIQLYEQRQNDINKAQVNIVSDLALALGCEVADLLE